MKMSDDFEKIASEAALKHLNSEAQNAAMAMGPLTKMLFSFYESSMEEGFTPEEALHLTTQMMVSSIHGAPNDKNK
jgi:hypothetical protein